MAELEGITGRDGWIMAQALFVAIQTLKRLPHPPESDIADMEKILDEGFPGQRETFEFQNNLKLALRLGWKAPPARDFMSDDPPEDDPPERMIRPEDLKKWLAEHKAESNVIALHDAPHDEGGPPK